MNKLNEAALLPGQKDLPSKLLHFIATCRREKDGGGRGVGRRRFPVRRWWGVRKKHLISPRPCRLTAEAGKPEAAGESPPGQCRKHRQHLGEGSPPAS